MEEEIALLNKTIELMAFKIWAMGESTFGEYFTHQEIINKFKQQAQEEINKQFSYMLDGCSYKEEMKGE